jgi:DNA-binding CsgD family transcriptional regulator
LATTSTPTTARERVAAAVAAAQDDPIELRRAGMHALRSVIAFDAWCCATLDPDTLIRTSAISEGLPTERSAAVADNEYAQADVLKYVDLARAARPVGALSSATADRRDSARYREILEPSGFRDEVRAVLRTDGGRSWGTLSLVRRDEDFGPRDLEVVEDVCGVLAEGLARSLFGGGEEAPPTEPGALIFGATGDLVGSSAAAAPWLELLSRPPLMQSGPVPYPVRAIARHTLATAAGSRARLPVGDGWAILHASPLSGEGTGATVLIAPAGAQEVVDLAAAAFGLTARERDVADLLIAGRSTEEIGHELHLSPYTVQDHLKELFRKLGVNSRARVVARLLGGFSRSVREPSGTVATRR